MQKSGIAAGYGSGILRKFSAAWPVFKRVEGYPLATAEYKPIQQDQNPSKTHGSALAITTVQHHSAPPKLRNSKPFWLWGGAGAAILIIAGLAYTQFWMPHAHLVAIEVADFAPVTRVLAINGRIAAVHSVDVRPLVSGTLETLPMAEGENVAANQVLGIINSDSQSAVFRQSMAALKAANETLQQAEQAYSRAVALGKTIATVTLENSEHAVQTAKQEVARLSALVDQARIALDHHTILAPMAGSVLLLNVDVGEYVTPSTVLLTMADLRNLVVEADVDEAYARQIAPDQPAIMQLAGETSTRAGHVSFVSTRVDVATGGLAIKITFDEPISAPIGLTVATNIIVDQTAAALSVPRTALETRADGTGVFVLSQGTARFQPITVVDWPASRLVVTSGLSVGDVVIVDATGLEDGAKVERLAP